MLLTLWIVAAAYYLMGKPAPKPAQGLPADPAGRRARAWTAIRSQDLAGMDPAVLYFQARLETGDFKTTKADGSPSNYALTRSLFNRHAGSGAGDWTRRTHTTAGGEVLRIYDSPEQSVRDIVQLFTANPKLYGAAVAAARAGDVASFAVAVAHGDGTTGFVGPAGAPKAAQYVADLIATSRGGTPA